MSLLPHSSRTREAPRRFPTGPRRRLLAAVEARRLVELAAPLVLASMASMGIAITDVVMMGWLGPEHLAAGAITSDVYSIVFYVAAGVLAAVATLAAQALGAGRPRRAREVLHQGAWAAVVLAVPGAAIVWHSPRLLAVVGVDDTVLALAAPYARWMALTYAAMTGVALMRHGLAALGRPRVFFQVSLVALGINALGNWYLMFGSGGLRGMGLAGAGASSALVSIVMLTSLLACARWTPGLRELGLFRGGLAPRPAGLREIFALGAPIGIGNLGEFGVFLFSTVLAGVLGPQALAAHAVALRTTGLVCTVPIGLAQAATVRVALAAGAGSADRIRRSAWTALSLVTATGALTALALVLLREPIARLFLRSAAPGDAILPLAALLLLCLAAVHPVDNLAAVATACLRGLADTRRPMAYALAGHWGVGFALSVGLAFAGGLGAIGLWAGLGAGALTVALAVLHRLGSVLRRPAPGTLRSEPASPEILRQRAAA